MRSSSWTAVGSASSWPERMPTASPSAPTPKTCTSVTTAASRALADGTSRRATPCVRAARAIDGTPRTGRTLPSRASSPTRARAAFGLLLELLLQADDVAAEFAAFGVQLAGLLGGTGDGNAEDQ